MSGAPERRRDEDRPPLPPFTLDAATRKARAAEDAWNSRDPCRVALAYTADSRRRDRDEFFTGRDAVVAFLTRKWERERDYRLVKEVWAFGAARVAVRFAYEWRDASGAWWRSHGNEMWEFAPSGLMSRREASVNDVAIGERDRLLRWTAPCRPDDHPGLAELGL